MGGESPGLNEVNMTRANMTAIAMFWQSAPPECSLDVMFSMPLVDLIQNSRCSVMI
jgi:hypothetical protein